MEGQEQASQERKRPVKISLNVLDIVLKHGKLFNHSLHDAR